MGSRDLSALDRDICQPLGRILQEAFADGIKRVFSSATSLAIGLAIYPSVSGTPAITEYAGIFLYQGDPGSTINYMYGLMIGLKVNNAPTYGAHFIRGYSHGSQPVESFLYYQNSGSDKLTYLVKTEAIVAPVEVGGAAGDIAFSGPWVKIKCRFATGDYYLVASKFT